MPTLPIIFGGQRIVNGLVRLAAVGLGAYFALAPSAMALFPLFVALARLFGILLA